ncbi:acyltransferase [Aliarcobacter butzleri]|uniref:acyltransferase n=1 Tax=Aliarcobacter butzleri TaxID=28197 RepID=UPI001EDAFC3B|nr:acyltransferase [Aliarcobacter butzleri]MCG3654161.1 acyltransferase [Aliarcobacter butzleri]MCG3697524.1 acyltransferase [Aliarcobacter butzleri]MCG3698956.1 acyltransferase [Aliarcobacter butzleri]MCT7619681.1 acyltransferase [Aliarcobacter butzleri]MDN5080221.1 acyltransferase [Aliarcobacter butzleri]
MLKLIKKFIIKKLNGIPLNIYFINFIFQKVFRIDKDCIFSKNYTSRVLCSEKIIIENNSQTVLKSFALSGGCYIQGCEGIYIGEGTIWSFNVSIISQDHDFNNYNIARKVDPIKIGKNCWIGTNSTILPGIELGDRTIVGANTVVTKSFPDGNVIIAGTPAKIIREL